MVSTVADETERVEYVFEGDVSSLKAATQAAIDLLSKYSNSMKATAGTDAFTASQKSSKSMNASINRMTKDVEKLQSKLKGVGDIKLPSGSEAAKAMGNVLQTVNNQMKQLGSTGNITTKTLTDFRSRMEAARSALAGTAPQVDKLVASEQRFQNVLGVVQSKADKFRSTMDNVRSRVSGTFDPVTNRLKSFSGSFDGANAKVQSFKDKASTSFSRVTQLAKACASAFRRTAQEADGENAAATRLEKSHRTLGQLLSDLAAKLRRSTEASSKLSVNFRNLSNNTRSLHSNFNLLGSSTSNLTKLMQTLSGVQIARWLSAGTRQSIAYIENLNLFAVAMGESTEKGLKFVDTMQEVYGMDPSNIYRYAGYFYQLTDAIGMTDEASATLSLSMTKAANDIASLFNVNIEQVVDNLASGMQGMSRAVRKYGMDIRATTLQQTALKYGLTEQVESMSEANRMALRYITMMEQVQNATKQVATDTNGTSAVMGDFARNIETPANQLRILKEQMAQLGRAVGNFIVAPLARAIAYLNGFVMALRMAINFVASLFGLLSSKTPSVAAGNMDKAASSVAGVGDAAGKATKKLKGMLAPFDELNVLQDKSSSDSGGGGGVGGSFDDVLDPALQKAIEEMDLKLEDINMRANQVRDALLGFFGFTVDAGKIISWDFDTFYDNMTKELPQLAQSFADSLVSNLNASISKIPWKTIGAVLGAGISSALVILATLVKKLDWSSVGRGMSASLNGVVANLDWASLGTMMVAGLAIAIKTLGNFLANLDTAQLAQGLSTMIISACDTIKDSLDQVDWDAVGDRVKEFLINIDWAGIFGAVVGTALEALSAVFEAFPIAGPLVAITLAVVEAVSIFGKLMEVAGAIAPVLDTLGAVIGSISAPTLLIIAGIAALIAILVNLWNTSESFRTAVMEGVQTVIDLLTTFWREIVKPIIDNIWNSLVDLWESAIKPVIDKVIAIVGSLIELIMALWNNVLAPIVDWIIKSLGPSISDVVNTVWNVVSSIIGSIIKAIDGLLRVLHGIIEFLTGVFTGDWKRAWKGLVNVFVGIGNTIISVFETVINSIIGLVNLGISGIFNGIRGLINGILGAVSGVARLLGANIDLRLTASTPQIPKLSIPRIPAMANGGVVSSPTMALIGEGRYDEAVIPLGNSPQMKELVDDIVDALGKDDSPQPDMHIHVHIGNEEVDDYIYRSNKRRELQTNGGT